MVKDLVRVKDRVEVILDEFPATRDCDKLLWLAYMSIYHDLKREIGHVAYIKLKGLIMDKNTATMESVRRVRQKFQEGGKYVGEKRKYRMDESERVREWARS